jgi:hypothetical protein
LDPPSPQGSHPPKCTTRTLSPLLRYGSPDPDAGSCFHPPRPLSPFPSLLSAARPHQYLTSPSPCETTVEQYHTHYLSPGTPHRSNFTDLLTFIPATSWIPPPHQQALLTLPMMGLSGNKVARVGSPAAFTYPCSPSSHHQTPSTFQQHSATRLVFWLPVSAGWLSTAPTAKPSTCPGGNAAR